LEKSNQFYKRKDKKMRKEASLSIIEDVKSGKLLMIRHQRGINKGYINFPGGKKEKNESMEDCVVRETLEETGLLIKNPQKVGYMEFPSVNFYVHIYKSTEFEGELNNKEDEVNTFWVDKNNIPLDEMREADQNFVPDLLAGKYINRRYHYDENFKLKLVEEL
jgi:8-oxo-dGTP pyrophosphatase MutT (NUDIX family)